MAPTRKKQQELHNCDRCVEVNVQAKGIYRVLDRAQLRLVRVEIEAKGLLLF